MAKETARRQEDEIARAMEEFGVETADEARRPCGECSAPDRSDAQGRARRPPGLRQQRQVAQGDRQQAQRLHPKTVRTSAGELEISVPRDRDGSFRPVAVPKGQLRPLRRRVPRDLHVRARDVAARHPRPDRPGDHGFSMSAETVSAITDRVWEDLERWRSGPLEPVYAFMFVDCLYVPVRDGRGARSAAVYAVLAYDLRGRKDVLGLDGRLRGAPTAGCRCSTSSRPAASGRPLRQLRQRGRGSGGPGGGLPGGDPPALHRPPGPQLAEGTSRRKRPRRSAAPYARSTARPR